MHTYSADELRTMPEGLLVDYAERVLRKALGAFGLPVVSEVSMMFQLVVEQFYNKPEHAYRLARL